MGLSFPGHPWEEDSEHRQLRRRASGHYSAVGVVVGMTVAEAEAETDTETASYSWSEHFLPFFLSCQFCLVEGLKNTVLGLLLPVDRGE